MSSVEAAGVCGNMSSSPSITVSASSCCCLSVEDDIASDVSEKKDAVSLKCCQRLDHCYFKDMAYLGKHILFLARPLFPNANNYTCF